MMRPAFDPCPPEDVLCRFTSGDVSVRRARQIRAHLEGCHTCRDRLHAITETLAGYRAVLDDRHETPRWASFQPALLTQESAWRRKRARVLQRWSSLAAAVVIAVVAIWWYQQTEVPLSAAELLTRVAAHEAQHPAQLRVPVRLARSTAVPGGRSDGGVRSALSRTLQPFEEVAATNRAGAELAHRLATYAFQPSAPLSARPFQQWRASTQAQDEPLRWGTGDVVTLAASNVGGAIRRAEITIRVAGYQPIAQAWQFADGFEVEVTSLPEPRPITPGPAPAATSATNAAPSPRSARDLDLFELDTRLALLAWSRRDVGDLSVHRRAARLLLDGVTPNPQLAQWAEAYGQAHPDIETHVRVRVGTVHVVSDGGGLHPWLERTFADGAARNAFVPRAGDQLAELDLAARGLAALASRYPAAAADGLRPPADRKLAQLIDGQYMHVRQAFEALERHLSPLVGALSRPVLPAAAPTQWRTVAAIVHQPIRELIETFDALCRDTHATTSDVIEQEARRQLRPRLDALAETLSGAQDGVSPESSGVTRP